MLRRKFKVAIVGNGKLAKAIVLGLLRSGKFSPSDMTVIVRPGCESDLSVFRSNGVAISRNIKDLAMYEHIILAVTPNGAGNVLSRLNRVDFSNSNHFELISFVSGLSKSDIKNSITTTNCDIIIATTNTNIAHNVGRICGTKCSKLFLLLGQFILMEDEISIITAIVAIGSSNASNCQVLRIVYNEHGRGYSLSGWLEELYKIITLRDWNLQNIHKSFLCILDYIKALTDIFSSDYFFYKKDFAKEIAFTTVESTVQALLSMSGSPTLDLINSLFLTVVTKGGCTEKGVNEIKEVIHVGDGVYLMDNAFLPMHVAASQFPRKVLDSIEEEKNMAA